jgi:hypothetical protein
MSTRIIFYETISTELGQLSADKLMEYIRSLHTTAISLGEEEGRPTYQLTLTGY